MRLPYKINLVARVRNSSKLEILSDVLATPLPGTVFIDRNSGRSFDKPEDLLAYFRENPDAVAAKDEVIIKLEDKNRITLGDHKRFRQLRLNYYDMDRDPKKMDRYVKVMIDFCEKAFERGSLFYASLYREGNYSLLLPRLPLVKVESYLTVCSREEIEQKYQSVQHFLEAGQWDTVAEKDGIIMVQWAKGAVAHTDYLRAVHRGHWNLARVVRPRLTEYYYPEATPAEEAIIAAEKRLEFVGYQAEEQRMVYTADLRAEQQVSPAEILGLNMLLTEEETLDGRPLREIVVLFTEEVAAEREKRPLLDIGARVQWADASGEIHEITDG